MRFRSVAAMAALLALSASGCDVEIDLDVEPDRAGASALAPLPEPGPDADVWTRRSRVVVLDEAVEVDLRLVLRSDDTYRMVVEVVEETGDRERETSEGRYRWDGRRLVLLDDRGESTTFRRRGEVLELEAGWPVDVVFAIAGLPDPTLRRAR